MVTYKRFAFASPPRTATTWFLQAVSEIGLGEGSKTKVHLPPPNDWNGYLVSFIRHPFDWLCSYYTALSGGHVGVPAVDQFSAAAKRCDNAGQFIKWVAMSNPGAVGRMFKSYRASTILRVEDLPWCALEFFESVGADKKKIKEVASLPPHNTTKVLPILPKKIKRMIMESEQDFCLEYDYI